MSRMASIGELNNIGIGIDAHRRRFQPRALSSVIQSTCMTAHHECLALVTRSLELEAAHGATAELISLVLATAQSCQSAVTLDRLSSAHLNTVLKSCIELCHACAEACNAPSLLHASAQECRTACLACAQAISVTLSTSTG